jgi:hypothetical protein
MSLPAPDDPDIIRSQPRQTGYARIASWAD